MSEKLQFPTIGTWRRCTKCLEKIQILNEVFWRLENEGETTYYHEDCKPEIELTRFEH